MRSKLPIVAAGLFMALLAARALSPSREENRVVNSINVRQLTELHSFKQREMGWLMAAASLAALAAGSAAFEWVHPPSDELLHVA